jgi:hypothetical protein
MHPQSRILVVLGISLSALFGACSSKPVLVVPPQATVSNQTGKPVVIRYQRCGSTPDQWVQLSDGALAQGGATRFPLPAECVNFDALYADGRVAGSQRSIRNEFPFEWVLR